MWDKSFNVEAALAVTTNPATKTVAKTCNNINNVINIVDCFNNKETMSNNELS